VGFVSLGSGHVCQAWQQAAAGAAGRRARAFLRPEARHRRDRRCARRVRTYARGRVRYIVGERGRRTRSRARAASHRTTCELDRRSGQRRPRRHTASAALCSQGWAAHSLRPRETRDTQTTDRFSLNRLLKDAAQAANAPRVASFFQGFLAQGGASSQVPAAHTSQRAPRTSSGQRIYDRAEITKMWERRRKGAISDADWAKWENELCRASAEGRVRGALNADGVAVSR